MDVWEQAKKWKEKVSSFGVKQWMACLLIGVCCFIVVIPTKPKQEQPKLVKEEIKEEKEIETQDYVTMLEQRLINLLSYVEDVGAVKVMITVESTTSKSVLQDGSKEVEQSRERDSEGGSRSVDSTKTDSTTVFSKEEPYFAIDYLWYLWCGKNAPTFDKDRMATFERYFLKDKAVMKETKGHYYTLRNEDATVDLLLEEFGVEGDHRHIVNGHIPVKTLKGENPMKASGRLIVIDGGFSKPYQSTTGIAGYTLVYHSRGMQLVEHQPFTSTEEAIRGGADIKSTRHLVEKHSERIHVGDTDKGRDIRVRIESLRKLLYAYQTGLIREVK